MRILLVEDEIYLANSIIKQLQNNNINVINEYDGKKALKLILEDNFDLIILDIMLPKLDGLSILQEVRKSGNKVPIIITSAKGEVEDKVKGLSLGADDYLSKPYSFEELLARIHTNLRRIDSTLFIDSTTFGNISLERSSLLLISPTNEMTLTLKEFDLLEALVQANLNPLSKEQLIDKVWGYNSDVLPNHVEVYISYLRKKLKLLNANFEIKTIRYVGYKLEINDV